MLKQKIAYCTLKLAGLIKEEFRDLSQENSERMADFKTALQTATDPDDALTLLYNWATKKEVTQEEFLQLAKQVMG